MLNKQAHVILFTGGGSAGHVTPNLALIARCQAQNLQVSYAGSARGIERTIISQLGNVPYYAIAGGKLRRYFSFKNFLEPFKILLGILQAAWLCWRLKPTVVFSKGGFVAFPIVVGAWLSRIPVICHESDLTPGLANRLSFPFAKTICVSFAQTRVAIPAKYNVVVTGTPVRASILQGDAARGRALCGFNTKKPIVLITGGGLGADSVNRIIRAALTTLLPHFQIVHLCGKNKTDSAFEQIPDYKQFDYVDAAMPDLLTCADYIVSRAGANIIYELITLRKPNLLIPLGAHSSRGDQIRNAQYCAEQGLSSVLYQNQLNPNTLLAKLTELMANQANYVAKLAAYQLPDSVALIEQLLRAEFS